MRPQDSEWSIHFTKTDTGTGLGMWVVSQLIERHKGHIQVWSTQRVGRSATVFSIFLPFVELSTKLSTGQDRRVASEYQYHPVVRFIPD
jgi:hypothetical protein